MVKASKGIMSATRQKFRKSPRERGQHAITPALQTFEVGEQARIQIDSAVQRGQPHQRFHGSTGTIVERRGRGYVLDVRFGGKVKQAVALPEHLKRL